MAEQHDKEQPTVIPTVSGLGGAESEDEEPNPESALLRKVAQHPRTTTDDEKQSTLDWFLQDEGGDEMEPHYKIEINVSTDPGREDFKPWVIKPIPSPRIDMIRRACTVAPNRAARRRTSGGQDLDAARFNATLVYEGTVDPDLTVPLKAGKFTDGAQLVLHRFRFKPLLVDQIAGQILEYSGGADEDVRTALEVKAAHS